MLRIGNSLSTAGPRSGLVRLFHSSQKVMNSANENGGSEASTQSSSNSSWASAAKSSVPSRNAPALTASMRRLNENQIRSQNTKKLDVDPAFVKKFTSGTTYDPFDFSMDKLRLQQVYRAHLPKKDIFDKNEINPLSLWTDSKSLSKFVSTNGSILPGRMTGTRGKNQRRLAKAIRRARAAGLLSTVHRDVSLLPREPLV